MSAQKFARSRWAAVNEQGRVIGADHHIAKLSEEDIELILALRDEGLSVRRIAAKFDDGVRVSKSMVHAICAGRRRRQTVMGQKRVSPRRFTPADIDEFDLL